MTQRHDVTIVTYRGYPDLYPDDELLRDALVRRGATVRAAVWDDPGVDWSAGSIAVLRSTWDYFRTPETFFAWLDRVEPLTRLVNAPDVVRWNADKSYLLELASQGFSVIPSALLRAGRSHSISALSSQRGWDDVVVKPAVSGASYETHRFTNDAPAAQRHADRLLERGRDVVVQPYLREIEADGEYAIIFIDGRLTHAARKLPFHGIPPDGVDHEARVEVPPEFEALAARILGRLDRPAYARVDLVPTPAGPLLMELELIEPSLFLRLHPESAERLADAVLQRVPQ
ncbi:MAG TPA: hypothetical protein VMF61_05170 [Candidatus Acidoferrales bacterium]|nr:hypothetical protein [Candidatus Acidoferrales bacterium]